MPSNSLPTRHPWKGGGFTLIELLVVIAIICLLASILFPVFGRARESARRSACLSNLKQIGLGLSQYTQDYDEIYPLDRTDGNTVFNISAAFNGDPNNTTVGISWAFRVMPYLKSRQVFLCPSCQPDPTNPVGTSASETLSYWAVGAYFMRFTSEGVNVLPEAVPVATIGRPATSPILYDSLNGTQEARRVFRPYWESPHQMTEYSSIGSFATSKTGMHFEGVNALYGDGHVKWQKNTALYLQLCPEWNASNAGALTYPQTCTAATKM